VSLPPLPPSTPPLPPTSRYFAVGTAVYVTAGGEEIIYLRRRFIPPPERFQLLQVHTVTEGERHDHLAARFLGDPEQFWRLCDANAVLRPEELTETPGQRIRITLPEGIAGPADA
jgi:hypothetical protein